MDKLFNKTPASNFAALALAGVMASGYMTFTAGKPVMMALVGGKVAGVKMAAMVQPNTQGSTFGSPKVEPLNSIQQQADKVASKVEELAQTNQTKNDVVLGAAQNGSALAGAADETSTVPVREEFPPAVNLLRNSSFEEDNNGAPRQWNYQYDSNSGNTKTTLEAIRTGAKGLKVVGGGTGNFGLSQPAAKEIERRDYAFSVWVKPVNTDAHTVKLSFWDEVNNKEAKSKTFSFSGTKEWSRLVFQISNKNTWSGKKWFPMITVNGLGSGALYIEDAQLEEASSFTPYHFTGGGATQSHVSILGDGSVEVDAHGNIYPAVNGVGGLGTGSNKFSELRLTKATIDNNGSLTLDGDITVNGNGTFKGAMSFDGTIKSHLIPDQDSTYDLGSTTKKWRWAYANGVYLQNAETIGNGTDGDITFTDSGTSNALVMDLNAASDAVELRNDTEDLRLRAAGNGNLVMRAGDGAANSNVDGNDLFLAAEDAMTLRSATYDLTTSGSTITMTALNSGITMSTGSDTKGSIQIKSAGSLILDTTLNNTNINILSGGDSSGSLTLRSDRGGIDLSTSSASGAGNLTLRSAGTLTLDSSALNSNIVANTGTGRLVATSNNAGITAIQLLATNGGIDISTSGVGGLGELRLRAGGSLKLDTSGNNNNILIDSGTGDLLANIGTGTVTAVDDAVAALGLNATRGGITLSSGSASGNGNIKILSGGTLQLSTSGNNSSVLLQAGTGAFTVNAGASTHTYTGAYAVTDTAQVSLTSNQAAINSIALLATNGGIDISTSGVGGLGELRLRAGGSLKLDTSGNNNNILVDTGTGDLLENVGTNTMTAQDDVLGAVAIRASRGGIQLSSSNASGNGDMRLLSAGTLQLDTSAANSTILMRTGTGTVNISSGLVQVRSANDNLTAIRLLADRGGIEISSGTASGNGNVTIKSAGTLTLDTSANNSNIMVRAGTGRIDLSGNTILVNSGAGTLDLSANNTISIVSSTTARVWGETGTLVGRAGTATRVHGRLCIEGSGDGSTCPAGGDGRLFVNTAGEDALDSGDVFDLAEYYPASEPVDPGTVVIADSNSRATVKMSQYAYQRVLGVVSTSPAIMINDGSFEVGAGARNYNVAKPLIALVGRVPVKVSSENGSIKVGDRLVASAKAGYAMKATKQGMTLGMALEDMSFENGATEAKVMTFVNVSWYFPEVVEELEKEYQTAQALGIQANAAAALTAATSSASAEGSDPSVNVGGSDPSIATTGVVAGDSQGSTFGGPKVEPSITVATPPTEFPNLIVTKALTVGKELKVSGKATFEGEVEVLADATFGKNVIIIGNLRIGGNLEVAGAVVTNMTAGASIAAGDPVAVGADGKTYRAGAGKAVIGVATLNAAAGEAVKVAVAGKVGNMTGLTTGSRYFVNEAGVLTTDGQGGQGLGVAVSATEMLVQPGIGLPAAAVTPVVAKEEPVKEETKPIVPAEQPVTLPVQSPTLTTTQVQEQPIVPQTGSLNPQPSTE